MAKEGNEIKEEPKKNGTKRIDRDEKGRFIQGNPGGGRPKGSVSVVEAIKRKLKEIPKDSKKSYLEYLTDALFSKAIKDKDINAIKDIINRVDGMPKQTIDQNINETREIPESIEELEEEAVRILDEVAAERENKKHNGKTDKE